jgi:tetratricopeptide (TPR) repeat protein
MLALLVTLLPAALSAQWAALAASDKAASKGSSALQALQEGRVEEAATELRANLAVNPVDAYAHQLLCRAFYAQDRADDAVHECELAAGVPNQTASALSDNQLWLGRAYGMKARHAGPIAAFRLARRVQACFAKAVELDTDNTAALSDLGEYYVDAPAIVGGGLDKARALAASMAHRFPGKAHLLMARIAAEEKNKPVAEAEFKQVVALEKTTAAWVDLALFYEDQGRMDDAVAAIQSGLALDRTHGPALVDAASVLISAHREPALAERCLRLYLSSHAKTDEAPAFKVHVQLGNLLAARGLQQEAGQHMEAATALAPAFMHSARPGQESR